MKIRLYQRQGIGDYLDTKILTVEAATPVDLDRILDLFREKEAESTPLVMKDIEPEAAEDLRVRIQKQMNDEFNKLTANLGPAPEQKDKSNVKTPPQQQASRPRTLPLLSKSVGHQTETVGSTTDLPNTKPDREGNTLYLAETDCEQCHKINEAWTRAYNKFIKCQSCGVPLKQVAATDGTLEADRNGHYFKASKKYEHYVHRK